MFIDTLRARAANLAKKWEPASRKGEFENFLNVFAKSPLLSFNSLKQKKLIFNFFVNCNWKKLTDSRKRAEILASNRKSHHPIETLMKRTTWKRFDRISKP